MVFGTIGGILNRTDPATPPSGPVGGTPSYVGDHDPTGGLPTTGSGEGGAIRKGDRWRISVAGSIPGLTPQESLQVNDTLVAKIDSASVVGDFYSVQGNVSRKIINIVTDGIQTVFTVVHNLNIPLSGLDVVLKDGTTNQVFYADVKNAGSNQSNQFVVEMSPAYPVGSFNVIIDAFN